MHSPQSLNIKPIILLPDDGQQVRQLKEYINALVRRLDEAYRLLHFDVRILDFRELPPHAGLNHSSWKFYENPTTGDLELWRRDASTWGKTYWDIIGEATRRPTIGPSA